MEFFRMFLDAFTFRPAHANLEKVYPETLESKGIHVKNEWINYICMLSDDISRIKEGFRTKIFCWRCENCALHSTCQKHLELKEMLTQSTSALINWRIQRQKLCHLAISRLKYYYERIICGGMKREKAIHIVRWINRLRLERWWPSVRWLGTKSFSKR